MFTRQLSAGTKRIILLVDLFLLLWPLKAGAEAEQGNISLTVYNQNFGLVQDVRYLNLEKGLNLVRFTGVPALIERESVHFRSLTHPGSCWIQGQTFEYDLIGIFQLLERHLNKEIQILDKENRLYSGELLSHNLQEIVLRRKNGTIVAIKRGNISSIEFPALPDALVTSPTLVWEIISEKAGQHKVEATYLTGGLNWKANYLAIIAPEGNFLNLNSWVTVNNTSGVAYSDATLKLIAGEVRRVKERPQVRMKTMMLDVAVPMATEFKHQPLFEYHIYTLPRRITLKDDQEKQILFLTSQNIPFRKVYTFETGAGHWRWDRRVGPLKAPVKVTIEFKNDKESGIGMPLPAGRVKVYKDSEGGLEFIGEDSIPHTPKSEEVKLHIGNAFDIIGKKKHTEHKEITRHIFENTYEISLRNHK